MKTLYNGYCGLQGVPRLMFLRSRRAYGEFCDPTDWPAMDQVCSNWFTHGGICIATIEPDISSDEMLSAVRTGNRPDWWDAMEIVEVGFRHDAAPADMIDEYNPTDDDDDEEEDWFAPEQRAVLDLLSSLPDTGIETPTFGRKLLIAVWEPDNTRAETAICRVIERRLSATRVWHGDGIGAFAFIDRRNPEEITAGLFGEIKRVGALDSMVFEFCRLIHSDAGDLSALGLWLTSPLRRAGNGGR